MQESYDFIYLLLISWFQTFVSLCGIEFLMIISFSTSTTIFGFIIYNLFLNRIVWQNVINNLYSYFWNIDKAIRRQPVKWSTLYNSQSCVWITIFCGIPIILILGLLIQDIYMKNSSVARSIPNFIHVCNDWWLARLKNPANLMK